MKFTSEDLMKAMGLQVGDTIKYDTDIWQLMYDENHKIYMFVLLRDSSQCFAPTYLVDQDFEILPRPKRVGELTCDEQGIISCNNCPIKSICSLTDLGCRQTLYEFLEDYKNNHKESFDQEIYDLLKARLDKEVNE